MLISSISDFRRAIRNGPYAWPGGYPRYFVMADGAALSFKAAKQERRRLLEALRDAARDDNPHKDWLPVAVEANHEDNDLLCAHTGEQIESTYGND